MIRLLFRKRLKSESVYCSVLSQYTHLLSTVLRVWMRECDGECPGCLLKTPTLHRLQISEKIPPGWQHPELECRENRLSPPLFPNPESYASED